uniref:Uncharacterized protein n=1 Tax=Myotis myotis TaxID=51298 RepID=A0A7J7YDJ1_MYOMY|nr:hypothetical protein mMyoMyo1_010951 [Myotis myotis]
MLRPNNGNRPAATRTLPLTTPLAILLALSLAMTALPVPQAQPSQETIASHCHPAPTSITTSLTSTLFHFNGEDRSSEGDFSQVPNPTDRVSALTVPAAPGHTCSPLQPALTRAQDPVSSACSGTLLLHLPSLLSCTVAEQEGRGNQRGPVEPIRGFQGIHTWVLEAEGCLLFGMLITTPKTREHTPRRR